MPLAIKTRSSSGRYFSGTQEFRLADTGKSSGCRRCCKVDSAYGKQKYWKTRNQEGSQTEAEGRTGAQTRRLQPDSWRAAEELKIQPANAASRANVRDAANVSIVQEPAGTPMVRRNSITFRLSFVAVLFGLYAFCMTGGIHASEVGQGAVVTQDRKSVV